VAPAARKPAQDRVVPDRRRMRCVGRNVAPAARKPGRDRLVVSDRRKAVLCEVGDP